MLKLLTNICLALAVLMTFAVIGKVVYGVYKAKKGEKEKTE